MPRPKKPKTESSPRTSVSKARRKAVSNALQSVDTLLFTPLTETENPLQLAELPAPAASPKIPLEDVLDALLKDLAAELEAPPNLIAVERASPVTDHFAVLDDAPTPAEPFAHTGLEAEMRAGFEATIVQAAQPGPVFQGLAALLTPASERVETPAGDNLQLLLFVLDEILYGLALEDLVEINRPLPITTLPNLPAWLPGIANVRGDIVSVLDVRAFFGQPSQEITPQQRMLLVRSKNTDLETLIVVDQVREFYTVAADQFTKSLTSTAQGQQAYLKGRAAHKEETVCLLDVERLLHDSCAWRSDAK